MLHAPLWLSLLFDCCRGLAPVARALQWSSSRLLPCGNDTVLNDPPLVYDLFLHLHIQGNCQFGAMVLVEVEELPHVVATQAL